MSQARKSKLRRLSYRSQPFTVGIESGDYIARQDEVILGRGRSADAAIAAAAKAIDRYLKGIISQTVHTREEL